jgi:hypothetical protein
VRACAFHRWGFGGYGRCGHGVPRDQMTPKALDFFSSEPRVYSDDIPMFMRNNRPPLRAAQIAAGGSCCYAISKNDNMLYFWGITKKAGEASMSPELFDGTSGWPVSSISVGMSSKLPFFCFFSSTFGMCVWGERERERETNLNCFFTYKQISRYNSCCY